MTPVKLGHGLCSLKYTSTFSSPHVNRKGNHFYSINQCRGAKCACGNVLSSIKTVFILKVGGKKRFIYERLYNSYVAVK